jgi:hypothetical protein
MKVILSLFALAASVFASPAPQASPSPCTPGTFACAPQDYGWLACTAQGVYDVSFLIQS